MQVTAAVARAPGADFTLETVELDEPRADEILVRVAAVGASSMMKASSLGVERTVPTTTTV